MAGLFVSGFDNKGISSINYPLVYYSFLLKPVRHVPIESILCPVCFWLLQEQLVLITCMTLQFEQLLSQLLPTHSTCQPVRHVPIESTLCPVCFWLLQEQLVGSNNYNLYDFTISAASLSTSSYPFYLPLATKQRLCITPSSILLFVSFQ